MSETMTPTWTLGDRIRKAREHAGMKQSDLALRLKTGRSTIAGWENGEHKPSFTTLEAIARACNQIPVEWLETGTIAGPDTRGYGRPWDVELPLWDEAA